LPQQIPGLDQLKDIHLPHGVSIWPLAPIYYGIILFCIATLGLIIFLVLRQRQAAKVPKAALKTLAKIQSQFADDNNFHRATEALSILLKRVCLAKYDRHKVASLEGKAWLKFLDDTGKMTDFSAGEGQLLIEAAYNPGAKTANHRLFTICEKWIKRNKA
jgi:hypothetical protein